MRTTRSERGRPAPSACSDLDPFAVHAYAARARRPSTNLAAEGRDARRAGAGRSAVHLVPARRHPRRAPRNLGGEALCLLITTPATTTTTGTITTTTSPTSGRPSWAFGVTGTRPLRIGIGGPVGSGKTALVAALCRARRRCQHGRRDHQRHLHHGGRRRPCAAQGRAARRPDRAVETGCCPHTAIRDDISANLDAVEVLEAGTGAGGPDADGERRRQPDRDLLPRRWSTGRSS